MTRIAVIGRSHVGALKLGWDQIAAEHPDLELRFFAAAGPGATKMALKDKVFGFHNTRPDPRERIFGNHEARSIDLTQFDHVLYAGHPTREEVLAGLLAHYDIDQAPRAGLPLRMSAAAFESMLGALSARRAMAPEWRHWSQPRLWVSPKPYPDDRCLQSAEFEHRAWQHLCADRTRLDWLRAQYMPLVQAQFAEHGITLLAHPAQSLADSGLTQTAYSVGSYRMRDDKTHDERDFVHMNADYGVLVMRDFLHRCLAPGHKPKTADKVI